MLRAPSCAATESSREQSLGQHQDHDTCRALCSTKRRDHSLEKSGVIGIPASPCCDDGPEQQRRSFMILLRRQVVIEQSRREDFVVREEAALR